MQREQPGLSDYGLLVGLAMIWGGSFLMQKVAVAEVPPVPALITSRAGTGCGSRSIWVKMLSAILLFPRQSVARSAYLNWSMK